MTSDGKAAAWFSAGAWMLAMIIGMAALLLEGRDIVTTLWVFAGFFAFVGVFFALAVAVSYAEKFLERPIPLGPKLTSVVRSVKTIHLFWESAVALAILGLVLYAATKDPLVAGILGGAALAGLAIALWWRRRSTRPRPRSGRLRRRTG